MTPDADECTIPTVCRNQTDRRFSCSGRLPAVLGYTVRGVPVRNAWMFDCRQDAGLWSMRA